MGSARRWGMGVGVPDLMRMIGTSAAGRARLRAGALGGFGRAGAGPRGFRGSPQPVLLDLDGNGTRVAEQSRSGVFVDAGATGCCSTTPTTPAPSRKNGSTCSPNGAKC